jgi:hypothetical protein
MNGKIRNWFVKPVGPDNAPCDYPIRDRVSRFWPMIKPNIGSPSTLRSVHDVLNERPSDKKSRAER